MSSTKKQEVTLNNFEQSIQKFVEKRSQEDSFFAEKVKNEKKSVKECCTYVINWVRATNRIGFEDDEIFGQVVHYYIEDDINVGSPTACTVIVNEKIELTEQEIEEAKQKARKDKFDQVVAEERKRLIKEVNVELTEDEKRAAEDQARQDAINKAIEQKKEQLVKKAKKAKTNPEENNQPTLF